MLSAVCQPVQMTPWQVIEEALARKRPVRSPQWLADQLDETIQVVSNWKARRVPPSRYREIAQILGLSVEQLEGLAPLPWDRSDWPFPDIDRARFDALTDIQKGEIQARVRTLIEDFESKRSTGSGKFSPSHSSARRSANG